MDPASQQPAGIQSTEVKHSLTSTEAPTDHKAIDLEDPGKHTESDKEDCSRATSQTGSPCPSNHMAADEDRTIVSFADDDDNDPSNPYNFSTIKKIYVMVTGIVLVMNSTMGSSVSSNGTAQVSQYFNVVNEEMLVLPTSIYLAGYVIGPLLFSPLTESFGRKPIMICTFLMYTAFTLGAALSPNFAALVVFRFFTGVAASSPISVVGGIYADIYDNIKARGLAITLFMTATTWGPLMGPIVSGYLSPVSWRWPYWVTLIVAGATWPCLLLMPETYGPIVLKHRAAKLRKKTGNPNIFAPIELQKQDLRELVVVVLTRPIRMFLFEAIVMSACLYLAVAYGIFYMYFQAYPIVFEGIYGFTAGETGLTFLPIGIGSAVACCVYLLWTRYLEKSRARSPPAPWTQVEEYLRLPLACVGGPMFVISLFWLGWTARSSIHWIVPTLSALPFGIGFLLVFMGELNYVVDSYEVYAASAMGATSCVRSLFGVVLPFAAKPMYTRVGVAWACSILGFISLFMSLIPFVFIRYGESIRARSAFCQDLKRRKEEKAVEDAERRRRRDLRPMSDVPIPVRDADLEKQV